MGLLQRAAFEVAGQIAAKSPTVIRAAKESLNGIDPIDVKRSYRFEQGFTFEIVVHILPRTAAPLSALISAQVA